MIYFFYDKLNANGHAQYINSYLLRKFLVIFEENFTGEYYASSYVMFNFFAQFKMDFPQPQTMNSVSCWSDY